MFKIESIYQELLKSDVFSFLVLQNTITVLLKNAYKLVYGSSDNCQVYIQKDSIQMMELKTVVNEEYSERLEIELQEAKFLKPDCKIGDKISIPFDTSYLSTKDYLKASTEIYRKTDVEEKKRIIEYIQARLEGFDLNMTEVSKVQPQTGKWESFYEPYKPFHHSRTITPTEKEIDDKYSTGFFDPGPNPFPFSSDGAEDDYGSESWS